MGLEKKIKGKGRRSTDVKLTWLNVNGASACACVFNFCLFSN